VRFSGGDDIVQGMRRRLVAQRLQHLRLRADEEDAGGGAGFGKSRILGQEAIARMDGVDLRSLGGADDVGDVQVGGDGLAARADQIAFVRLETVQGEAVLVGVDRDGANAHFRRCPHHADGNFAAIGDKKLADPVAGFVRGGHCGFLRRGVAASDYRIVSMPEPYASVLPGK